MILFISFLFITISDWRKWHQVYDTEYRLLGRTLGNVIWNEEHEETDWASQEKNEELTK